MNSNTSEYNDRWGEFRLSTSKTQLDFDTIFKYLNEEAYWSKGKMIPEGLQLAIDNSLNFGVYLEHHQVGYCRVVSDGSTMAYLADVFILPPYRGKGLSKWMLSKVLQHPDLQNLRRWILLTDDAHELYRKFGWTELTQPHLYMERIS